MAIFRCKNCDYLREIPNENIGKTAKCPSCQTPSQVQDTLMALSNMLADLKKVATQNQQLQKQQEMNQSLITQLTAEKQQLATQLSTILDQKRTTSQTEKGYAFANRETDQALENTDGVVNWLKKRQIQAVVDKKALDISGFFDEVAVSLGDNLDCLKPLITQITWAGRKGYDTTSLELPSNPDEVAVIKKFCHELYEYAFVTKVIYTKENKVLLVLQKERHIVNFFNGDWLEWYAFMKVASLLLKQRLNFSVLRNFEILFAENKKHELDVFFVLQDRQPLWIECKSGEFRDSIEKYSKIRKLLGVSKEYALLLVIDLPEEKIRGFSGMFDITILSERTFLPYLTQLLEKTA